MPVFRYEKGNFVDYEWYTYCPESVNPKTDILICLDNRINAKDYSHHTLTIGEKYRMYEHKDIVDFVYILTDDGRKINPMWATFLVIDSGRTFETIEEEEY